MSAIQTLLDILDLEQLEVNLFRGRSPQVTWQRVFGGQVIGQALVAACRTVDVKERPPHSLHAYFLLAGDPKVPIIYEVERVRDGKSFTTRRVMAIQHGEPIFIMSVSFHRQEEGLTHQAEMPDVPHPRAAERSRDPRTCHAADAGAGARDYERERPIELRPVEYDRYLGKKIEAAASTSGSAPPAICPTSRYPSMRARLRLRHDAARLRADAARPQRVQEDDHGGEPDHALWLHRPFRADDWLLYAQDSPNVAGARGFSRGLIFARDGTLVASVAQEGLVRERRTEAVRC